MAAGGNQHFYSILVVDHARVGSARPASRLPNEVEKSDKAEIETCTEDVVGCREGTGHWVG